MNERERKGQKSKLSKDIYTEAGKPLFLYNVYAQY